MFFHLSVSLTVLVCFGRSPYASPLPTVIRHAITDLSTLRHR
jgi:hypothetical protein